jgi:hypothetical protein
MTGGSIEATLGFWATSLSGVKCANTGNVHAGASGSIDGRSGPLAKQVILGRTVGMPILLRYYARLFRGIEWHEECGAGDRRHRSIVRRQSSAGAQKSAARI